MKTRIMSVLGLGLLLLCRPSMAEEPATRPDTENVESLKQEILRLKEELKKRDAEIEKLKKRLDELDKKPAPETQPAAGSAAAEKYPQQWVTSFKLAEKNREFEIKEIDARIKNCEQQLSQPRINETAKAKIRSEIATLQKERRKLKKAEVPPLPTLYEMEVDYAGPILKQRVQVLQIISGTEMRAKFLIQEKSVVGGHVFNEQWSKPVRFRGVNTSALADDEYCSLSGIFIICKAETYTTASGAKRTEYVLESIDGSTWKTAYLRWKKEQGAKPKK